MPEPIRFWHMPAAHDGDPPSTLQNERQFPVAAPPLPTTHWKPRAHDACALHWPPLLTVPPGRHPGGAPCRYTWHASAWGHGACVYGLHAVMAEHTNCNSAAPPADAAKLMARLHSEPEPHAVVGVQKRRQVAGAPLTPTHCAPRWHGSDSAWTQELPSAVPPLPSENGVHCRAMPPSAVGATMHLVLGAVQFWSVRLHPGRQVPAVPLTLLRTHSEPVGQLGAR